MYSLKLGLDQEESKIWLGGYDRSVIMNFMNQKDTLAMTDEELDSQIIWLPIISKYFWMINLSEAKIDD